jgi:hypothetical protein
VALGIFKAQGNTTCARKGFLEEGQTISNFSESCLWIPQAPAHQGLTISALEPSQAPRPFDPLINIDFGGPHGVLLASLTRLVVHMVSEFRPIVGLEFVYNNRSIKFGLGGVAEISALIDGQGGERIINVEVVIDDPKSGMRGLQV